MNRIWSMFGVALTVTACGGSPRAPLAPVLTVDGAAYEVPAGWSSTQGDSSVVIEDPERAVRVAIVATGALPPTEAVAGAWRRLDPSFALTPATTDEPPPEAGWDQSVLVSYELPASSARGARAVWRRFGTHGYAALIVGDNAALDRRDAQVTTILGSLRPAGMRDETFAGAATRPIDAAHLDAFIARALADLRVPGAAVAVIADGTVRYERTFGVRALGEPAPITTDTRFLLASITKPMTTLMQARLVDKGTVRWDSPVTTLLPTFALADAAFTRELTLWQMSCACTGMPRQDLEGLFEWEHVTPEQRIAGMRTMRPTTKLGETFQYSNPMVAAGGFAVAHAYAPTVPLAEAYALVMQRELFAPIGMTSTTLDIATVARGDHARPHAVALDGTTHVMPLVIERAVEPIAPAGGVWTTLRDMERYVETELAEGVGPDGTRVVSTAAYRERTRLRVRSDEAGGYGLGLDVGTYAGVRTIGHDGGSFGFGTTMFMLPDQHIGIIIFTNVRNGSAKQQLPFNAAVTRAILEQLFAAARPRADLELAYYVKLRGPAPQPRSTDIRWVAPLVGRYHADALGDLTIRARSGVAVLDAGEWATAIDRKVDPDGTTELIFLDPPFAGGSITVRPDGALTIPGQTSYVFIRGADAD